MTPPDIAGTVRAELARQRKSRQALQERIGISRTTMRRRLTGELPFTATELLIIADFLGMTASELLGEEKVSA